MFSFCFQYFQIKKNLSIIIINQTNTNCTSKGLLKVSTEWGDLLMPSAAGQTIGAGDYTTSHFRPPINDSNIRFSVLLFFSFFSCILVKISRLYNFTHKYFFSKLTYQHNYAVPSANKSCMVMYIYIGMGVDGRWPGQLIAPPCYRFTFSLNTRRGDGKHK